MKKFELQDQNKQIKIIVARTLKGAISMGLMSPRVIRVRGRLHDLTRPKRWSIWVEKVFYGNHRPSS